MVHAIGKNVLFIGFMGTVMFFAQACSDSKTEKTDSMTQKSDALGAQDSSGSGNSDSGGLQNDSTQPTEAGTMDYAPSAEAFGDVIITFQEEGQNVVNEWTFVKGSTKATLKDVGEKDFTYEKTGPSKTVIIFKVDGDDKYEMTWTSAAGGTCLESFDGGASNRCTFTVKLLD